MTREEYIKLRESYATSTADPQVIADAITALDEQFNPTSLTIAAIQIAESQADISDIEGHN